MQLLHNRLSMDIQRQHQSELLRSVLSGGTAGVSAARRLGLVGEAFRVMAVVIRESGSIQHNAPLTSCWQLMSMHLSTTHRGAAIAQLGDTLYTVLPIGSEPTQSRKEAFRLADALSSRIGDELRDRLLIGIGGSISTLAEIPQSRRQADEVLRVLRKNVTSNRVATIDDVRIQVVLQRLSDLESTDPLGGESHLQVIERYDAHHNTSYLETLKVHLSSFGDPTIASERLSVHTNTLRYRMRRLRELFDVDLDDADVRLGLLLQFRLNAD
jgi:sugar diacid utilization regulator